MSQKLILVLNCGSSSLKGAVLDNDSGEVLLSCLAEKLNLPDAYITFKFNGEKHKVDLSAKPDHTGAVEALMEELKAHGLDSRIGAIGHRVVSGGELYSESILVDDEVIAGIEKCIPLAPLHNPAHLLGLRAAQSIFKGLPNVVVFDTAFHQTMPEHAYTYAVPHELYEKYGLRRYGAHGTSYRYVSDETARFLGKDKKDLRMVIAHLGNGASITAVANGESRDTSMGLTPLEGLVMGTRSGDVDPGIIFHLHRSAGMSIDEIDQLLNRSSGVKGISGVNDFRELDQLIEQGDQDAWLAYNIYIHQLRRYIGSYMVALGRVDAITFTAGVGENAPNVRADALANLEELGIKIDPERNSLPNNGAREISTDDSKIKVFVVPTNEELAIARYAMKLAAEA